MSGTRSLAAVHISYFVLPILSGPDNAHHEAPSLDCRVHLHWSVSCLTISPGKGTTYPDGLCIGLSASSPCSHIVADHSRKPPCPPPAMMYRSRMCIYRRLLSTTPPWTIRRKSRKLPGCQVTGSNSPGGPRPSCKQLKGVQPFNSRSSSELDKPPEYCIFTLSL